MNPRLLLWVFGTQDNSLSAKLMYWFIFPFHYHNWSLAHGTVQNNTAATPVVVVVVSWHECDIKKTSRPLEAGGAASLVFRCSLLKWVNSFRVSSVTLVYLSLQFELRPHSQFTLIKLTCSPREVKWSCWMSSMFIFVWFQWTVRLGL